MQAEAAFARVNQARSVCPATAQGVLRGDPTFWGGYVQASYFLTGEHRGYDRRFGTFDRPVVKNRFNPKDCGGGWDCADRPSGAGARWGAWEVAYRYSYLDLNDNQIAGGQLGQHTWGLNWYFNDNFKVQFQYSNIQRNVTGPAISGTVHGFGMLSRWYF